MHIKIHVYVCIYLWGKICMSIYVYIYVHKYTYYSHIYVVVDDCVCTHVGMCIYI